jgi:hypothetical protein
MNIYSHLLLTVCLSVITNVYTWKYVPVMSMVPDSRELRQRKESVPQKEISHVSAFWKEGLMFKCTGCGRCCQNDGEVKHAGSLMCLYHNYWENFNHMMTQYNQRILLVFRRLLSLFENFMTVAAESQ